jgi:hypothetical protein
MSGDRKKPGLAFWASVVVVVAGLYVLSVGPAAWLEDRGAMPAWAMPVVWRFYTPLIWACSRFGPTWDALVWYAALWGALKPGATP